MSAKRVILACVIAIFPSAVYAQSGISGLVTDTSGAVLPGVTVEASSPALIERTRAVTTDAQGRYSVADLRPGDYRLSFTLQGFSPFIREGVELPSNFIATINAQLKVGSLEESVTVTGASPVVDVQNASHTTVISREVIDAVPTMRNFAPVAALTPAIKLSAANVGGARSTVQQRLTVHSSVAIDTTVEVDGMKMNAMLGDSQGQHNDAMTQEVTVRTSALPAEVSAGGVYLNLIPREGGNQFSGAAYIGYSGSSFQSDNLTQELFDKGLRGGDKIAYVVDVNPSIGGPIVKDRLWFFSSFRAQNNKNYVANSFFADGSPGYVDPQVWNYTARLTFQASKRNKLTAYLDRALMPTPVISAPLTDPATASTRRTSVLFYTGAIKWSSPVSSRLLLEAGYGAHAIAFNGLAQPGIERPYGTSEWFANASRTDIITGTRTTAPATVNHDYPFRYQVLATAAYITGSHSFKAGIQDHWGWHKLSRDANADLNQRYRSGAPDSVLVYNTPTNSSVRVNADLGAYVQDSWTLGRLTMNPGLRFDYFNTSIEEVRIQPGRFIGARVFPRVPNIVDWFDVLPRFGAVYDLTGDSKTALKFHVGKYDRQYTSTLAFRYDPAALQSDTRDWRDTNGDNIAQDTEIGPSNNANFGARSARNADPNLRRPYDMQYTVGVDREILKGISVGGSWFRSETYRIEYQDNLLLTSADYTAFVTTNPLTLQPITLYNLNVAKRGLVDILDRSATDRGKTRQSYTGLEASFMARLPRGANVFGGWSSDRPIVVSCGGDDPNTFLFCDQSQLDVPFTHDFKVSGSTPIAYGVSIGASWQSYAGNPLTVNWPAPATVFPGGLRTVAVTVPLIPAGEKYLRRWNQLDLNFKRVFTFGRVKLDGTLEIYNALNNNVVLTENQTFGSSLGQPLSILQPRVLRISTQVKF